MKQKYPPLIAAMLALGLAGCGGTLDMDLRDSLGNNFDTTNAAHGVADLDGTPPDVNGVITYPDGRRVVTARAGDRVLDIALRVGANPSEVATFNGISEDTRLQAGQIIALPDRENSLIPAPVQRQELTSAPEINPPEAEDGLKRHRVILGETVFTVARLYSVEASDLAALNSITLDTSLQDGQILIIPQVLIPNEADTQTQTADNAPNVSAPGEGSTPPPPPSSMRPQPRANPAAAQPAPAPKPADTGSATQASATKARLLRPVEGPIIRPYEKDVNDGIDIAAPAGTAVKAADDGTVIAITQDTNGVTILIVKHSNNLLTVYTNISGLTVEKGATVTRGQKMAEVAENTTSFLHFEVRDGLTALNPDIYI